MLRCGGPARGEVWLKSWGSILEHGIDEPMRDFARVADDFDGFLRRMGQPDVLQWESIVNKAGGSPAFVPPTRLRIGLRPELHLSKQIVFDPAGTGRRLEWMFVFLGQVSEKAKLKRLAKRLASLGFQPTHGPHGGLFEVSRKYFAGGFIVGTFTLAEMIVHVDRLKRLPVPTGVRLHDLMVGQPFDEIEPLP